MAFHGHSVGYKTSRTYNSWASMIQRCKNPKNISFKNYGAKGVAVCARWHKFENFLEDMGERTERTTLDRIKSEKGYGPGNCRWADRKTQARCKHHLLTFDGQTLPIGEWASKLGMKYRTLAQRIHGYGWPLEKAFTEPVRHRS